MARSTLTAETLAFTDGTNSAYFIHQLATKSSLTHPSTQTVRYTDNKFLYDSDNTTTQITDQRLQVENLAIREMNENGKIELSWIVNDNRSQIVWQKRSSMQRHHVGPLKWQAVSLKHNLLTIFPLIGARSQISTSPLVCAVPHSCKI